MKKIITISAIFILAFTACQESTSVSSSGESTRNISGINPSTQTSEKIINVLQVVLRWRVGSFIC